MAQRPIGSPNILVKDHIEALQKQHAELETELEDENNRPMPDMGAIADLKRQKLAIKDEIVRLPDH